MAPENSKMAGESLTNNVTIHTKSYSPQGSGSVASSSTQTTNTSFILCKNCVTTHQTLMESVSLVVNECGKLKLCSELGLTDWTAMLKHGELDLSKWRSALRTDMESLSSSRARLHDTMVLLTAEKNGIGSKMDSIRVENNRLLDEVATLKVCICDRTSENRNVID